MKWIRLLSLAAGLALMSGQTVRTQEVQEDCLAFNLNNIRVERIQNRWKIVDGNHWILDFDQEEGEARQSFNLIQKYRFDHICFVGRPNPSMTYFTASKAATTVIVVRHAERAGNPGESNPPLTPDGEKRAETLARMLKAGLSVNPAIPKVSVVFSTKFPGTPGQPVKRTFETVNNYAVPENIPIQYYDYSAQGSANLVNQIKSNYAGRSVLVAGHSDTVADIVQKLGVSAHSIPSIGNDFNNLLIVTISPTGTASLTHFKYETWQSIP
jgi:phosphohistidine phosphatase SixA